MNRRIYFIILFSIFTLTACNSPKSLYKKGNKMEAAQLNLEASNYYYQALIKKPEYIEAREALTRSGNQVLSDRLSTFFNESQLGNKKEAINAYLSAKQYKESLEKVSVKLNIPPQYTTDFVEIKEIYLLELYEKGLEYLDQEEYDDAENMFKEIERLEPDYKDSKKLKNIAYIEPFYRSGVQMLEENKYRSAYNSFLEVVNVNPNYKDAKELQANALETGLVSVGLISFENATQYPNAQKKAEAYNLNALSQTKDPFLKVIDRTNYDQLLNEQKINLSGAVNESTASEAGKLLGVKWLLGGTLLEMTKKTGDVKRLKRDGFVQFKVKKKNDAGEEYYETQYRRTVYYEYTQSNTVNVSVQIKLISLTTGEIEVSKIFTNEIGDQIKYYSYDGDATLVYPSVNGKVVTDNSEKKQMDQYFNGRKNIKSVETLSNDAFVDIAKQVQSEVEKFSYYYVK
jgi:tetratricopeptide (TPR) repeat protein